MRVTLLIAACVAGLGCTRSNMGYAGGGGGSGGVGGAGGSGGIGGGGGSGGIGGGGGAGGAGGGAGDMLGGGSDDLAGGTTDFALPRVCTADQRRCFMVGGVVSQGCDTAGQWRTDRRCPFGDGKMTGAMCMSGYCDPPTTTAPPTDCGSGGPSEQLCEQTSAGQGQKFSCQPFITDPGTSPAGVAWSCAVPATVATGIAGTKCTSNAQCHTGFCGSNGTCFWGCRTAAECLLANNLKCADVMIHVEGKEITAASCIPN